MLTINQLTGFAARGKHAQASFITSAHTTSLSTGAHSATFSSVNLGTPSPNRIIAVCLAGNESSTSSAGFTINSVTIGGINATVIATNQALSTNTSTVSYIAYIKESTLSSANIVVNYTITSSGTLTAGLFVSVYNVINQNNIPPYANAGGNALSGSSLSENIAVPLLGCVIGVSSSISSGSGSTWGNLTDDVTYAFSTDVEALSGHNNTASMGNLAVSINASALLSTALSLASWQ